MYKKTNYGWLIERHGWSNILIVVSSKSDILPVHEEFG